MLSGGVTLGMMGEILALSASCCFVLSEGAGVVSRTTCAVELNCNSNVRAAKIKQQMLRRNDLERKRQTYLLSINATTSISTRTSFGSRATSTVERAGGFSLKNSPYTSFIAGNSFISFKKTVVLTTDMNDVPA